MAKTKHIHKRMSQRGISTRLVDLVTDFGIENGDKVILDRKNTEALLKAMDEMRKDLLRAHTRGGIVVVEHDGVQITTYAVDSYSSKKAGASHAQH